MSSTASLAAPTADRATIADALICLFKERFEGVSHDLAGCGHNYAIMIRNTVFKIRNYDDLPECFAVVSPVSAIKSPQARHLTDYLRAEFECEEVVFYDAVTNHYREVDLQTLEFQTFRF